MEISESYEIERVSVQNVEPGDEITFSPGFDLMDRNGTITAKAYGRDEWRQMVVHLTVDSAGDEFNITLVREWDTVERVVR